MEGKTDPFIKRELSTFCLLRAQAHFPDFTNLEAIVLYITVWQQLCWSIFSPLTCTGTCYILEKIQVCSGHFRVQYSSATTVWRASCNWLWQICPLNRHDWVSSNWANSTCSCFYYALICRVFRSNPQDGWPFTQILSTSFFLPQFFFFFISFLFLWSQIDTSVGLTAESVLRWLTWELWF